jgi:hypothetical protein
VAALVFCALIATVVAVLSAMLFGFRALAASSNGHPQAVNLGLLADNLLEPMVTILIIIVSVSIFQQAHPRITDVPGNTIRDTLGDILELLPPAIPLTLMLLKPLFVRVRPPLRITLLTYGLLRWANTIAMWTINLLRRWELQAPQVNGGNGPHPWLNQLETIEGTLIVSGTLILCLSVTHLAGLVSDLNTPTGS